MNYVEQMKALENILKIEFVCDHVLIAFSKLATLISANPTSNCSVFFTRQKLLARSLHLGIRNEGQY